MKRFAFAMAALSLFDIGCRPYRAMSHEATLPRPPIPSSAAEKMVADCDEQTRVTTGYDPAYVTLTYPGGDVARTTGVCADVVIRAFRAGSVDLQKAVDEDMTRHFAAYPKLWGLKRPDSNIDHRRVANLMRYFERKGKVIPISHQPGDYLPGDVVAWRLPNNRLHIGVVSDKIAPGSRNPLVVHNIGAGARREDALFAWPIIGHYRIGIGQ